MARTLLVSKSTIWFIHIKHKCTSQRSNTKRLQKPQKTTEVYDDRIISMAKKNIFKKSNQVRNTIAMSLSKFTMKRHLNE